jgi:chaperonin GroES
VLTTFFNESKALFHSKQLKEELHMPNIKPLGDRVVIRPETAEETTAGGLYIPDTAKEKPQRGTIVAAGPGRVENGNHIEMSVKEGDVVLYGKYSGTDITLEGDEYLIVRESDILGIVS